MKRNQQPRRQLGNIERQVLHDLTAGDMLYGFLLSGRSTGRMRKLARERANNRYRRKLAIERLSSYGYIAKRGGTVCITAHGQSQLDTVADKNQAQLKTKRWDKKWRIVVYDIPDQYARLRRQIRLVLKRAGFVKLQQSVWVFPHDCEALVSLIQKESQVSDRVLYGVLEKIQNDIELRKKFGL